MCEASRISGTGAISFFDTLYSALWPVPQVRQHQLILKQLLIQLPRRLQSLKQELMIGERIFLYLQSVSSLANIFLDTSNVEKNS